VSSAEEYLGGMADTFASASWRLTMRGKQLFSMPRIAVLRSIMLNHWYHHRGQLSVYLRLLDVPVPVIYGAVLTRTRSGRLGFLPHRE